MYLKSKIKQAKGLYQAVSHYLTFRLNRVQYIMVVATIVGVVSDLAAVLLKTLVHYLQRGIEEIPVSRFSYLLFPALGLVITVLIVRVMFRGRIEKGIAMVLKAIARNASFIPLKHTYQHIITSSVTVGLGGSVGLESPIVATGSAVGSNLARIHDLNYRERTLLIGCGAASGIAAVFNAPIAGVIFAIEVLLVESIVSYFIPLIISAAIG
ncbi:MAG TPA: chloride channel protein, partial [Flavitalea sp.]|nr:chloride channel protein [Flavitalea sp.]